MLLYKARHLRFGKTKFQIWWQWFPKTIRNCQTSMSTNVFIKIKSNSCGVFDVIYGTRILCMLNSKLLHVVPSLISSTFVMSTTRTNVITWLYCKSTLIRTRTYDITFNCQSSLMHVYKKLTQVEIIYSLRVVHFSTL